VTYETWTRRLRKLRVSRNLTQAEFAKKIRVSRSHYTMIENGKAMINFALMAKMAQAFRLSFIDFMTATAAPRNVRKE
jgi:transcriptional regulator with XRE-family HTH domain